ESSRTWRPPSAPRARRTRATRCASTDSAERAAREGSRGKARTPRQGRRGAGSGASQQPQAVPGQRVVPGPVHAQSRLAGQRRDARVAVFLALLDLHLLAAAEREAAPGHVHDLVAKALERGDDPAPLAAVARGVRGARGG